MNSCSVLFLGRFTLETTSWKNNSLIIESCQGSISLWSEIAFALHREITDLQVIIYWRVKLVSYGNQRWVCPPAESLKSKVPNFHENAWKLKRNIIVQMFTGTLFLSQNNGTGLSSIISTIIGNNEWWRYTNNVTFFHKGNVIHTKCQSVLPWELQTL